VIKEIIGQGWGASTSTIPPVNGCVVPYKPTRKVSTQKQFPRICVDLMKYETLWNTLYEMIDHYT
jgi:hypothetical protein